MGFRLLALALLATAAGVARGTDDAPPPPPARGELRTQPTERLKGQVAPPVALPDGRALVFQADGDRLVLNWVDPTPAGRDARQVLPAGSVPLGLRLDASGTRPARLASAQTDSGVWLVGPKLHFIPLQGPVRTWALPVPHSGATVVGLPGDRLVVLGGTGWPERRDAPFAAERLWLDRSGALQRQVLSAPPGVRVESATTQPFESGIAAHVGGGRVLVAMPQASWLLEPGADTWLKLPGLPGARPNAATLLLPDGRLWVSGGGFHGSTTSELWDPATRRWVPGPDLPLPMSGHRALWSPDTGTALLGAGTFPAVLGWKPGEDPVGIAAQSNLARRGGALLALPGSRVAVVSGLSARACCNEHYGMRSPGASVAAWSLQAGTARDGAWPWVQGGGLAQRGTRLLAVGGRLMHTFYGHLDEDDTRLAETVDLRTGQLANLPPLPFDSARAEVAWLDEQRALVHAERSGDGQPGGLAVLNVAARRWQVLDADPLGTHVMSDGVHGRVRLLGADTRRAWIVGEDARVHWLDSATLRRSEGPRLQRRRKDLRGRVLADGRVVVAGGAVEADVVATRPAQCADCDTRYVGWGAQLPSRRHEIFDPATGAWTSSAPSRAPGGPVTILADGRVAKLGTLAPRESPPAPEPGGPPPSSPLPLLLELSSPNGQFWRSLPLPPALARDLTSGDAAAALADLLLLAPVGEGVPYAQALFLGQFTAPGVTRWWWLPSVDAAPPTWRSLPEAINPHRFPAGVLALEADEGPALARGSEAGVGVVGR